MDGRGPDSDARAEVSSVSRIAEKSYTYQDQTIEH